MYAYIVSAILALLYQNKRFTDINEFETDVIKILEDNLEWFRKASKLPSNVIFGVATAECIVEYHYGNIEKLTPPVYKEKYIKYFEKYSMNFNKSLDKNVFEWYLTGGQGSHNNVLAVSRTIPIGLYFKVQTEIESQTRMSCLSGFNNGNVMTWSYVLGIILKHSAATKKKILQYINSETEFEELNIENFKNKLDVLSEKIVPIAISVYFQSENIEDAISNVLKLDGNTVEIAAIVGGLFSQNTEISDEMTYSIDKYLDQDMIITVRKFDSIFKKKKKVKK